MFHLARALVFIACLIAACTVNWWTGVIALIVSLIVIHPAVTSRGSK